MHHNDSAFASSSVLVQNSNTSSSEKEITYKEKDTSMIMEIKDGDSHFNENSIPSSINQRLASSKEKTLAASSHVTVVHIFYNHDVDRSPQSMVRISRQLNSLKTWKRLLRQCSPCVSETQSEPKKKRKSSFNSVYGTNPQTNVFRFLMNLKISQAQWWRLLCSLPRSHESFGVELSWTGN